MQTQPMQIADRCLFILERMADGLLHTAEQFAAATGVDVRTVYRDMNRLRADGAAIISERGTGYMLRKVARHV